MEMKRSKTLDVMRGGGVANCTKLSLYDSRAIEIACLSGFDCLWVDTEHVPNDWDVVERQVLAAKAYDTDIIVRVARGSYSDLIKPLELDATGIMVPHIMDVEDAKRVVYYTRFHPIGRRPIDGGNADGKFCILPVKDYLAQSNDRRMLIVQIEDKEAVPYLEEICKLDGIDVIFFGPGDYSHSLGIPGQTNHPDVERLRRRIPEICARYGKFAGTTCAPEEVPRIRALGYRFISTGGDVLGLHDYFEACRRVFDE